MDPDAQASTPQTPRLPGGYPVEPPADFAIVEGPSWFVDGKWSPLRILIVALRHLRRRPHTSG